MLPPELIKTTPDFLKIKLNSDKFHGDGPIDKTVLLFKKIGEEGAFTSFKRYGLAYGGFERSNGALVKAYLADPVEAELRV